MACNRVDFPEPFGPVTAYEVPVVNSKFAFLKIHSRLKRLPPPESLIVIHFGFRGAFNDADLGGEYKIKNLLLQHSIRHLLLNGLYCSRSTSLLHKQQVIN